MAPAFAFPSTVDDIQALGPRIEGSQAEASAFAYLEKRLKAAGLGFQEFDFSQLSADYSRSKTIETLIKGRLSDELVLLIPFTSYFDAKDGLEGACGIASALDEAVKLSRDSASGHDPAFSLRFVFLGAEKRGAGAAAEATSLGTREWIARQDRPSKIAAIYLDLSSPPARISARYAGHGVLAPYWYYEASKQALEESGIDSDIEINQMQVARMGLSSDFGSATPYLDAGIPAIELRGQGKLTASEAAVSADWLGKYLASLEKQLAQGFPSSWDRHYFMVQVSGFSFAVREQTYIALLLGILSAAALSLLGLSIFHRSTLSHYVRRIPRMAAEFAAIFILLLMVLLLGRALSYGEALVFGSLRAWTLFPQIFATVRLLLSLVLFLGLLFFLVSRRILTPNPYFYELAALFWLAVDVFIFSATDLSLSFYFLWALIIVELSFSIRRRWLTLASCLLMCAPLAIIAIQLFSKPDIGTYQKLMMPGDRELFALAALAFPFCSFFASPLLLYARRGRKARITATRWLLFGGLILEMAGLALGLYLFSAAGPKRQDLSISETVDQDKGLVDAEIFADRRIGHDVLFMGDRSIPFGNLGDHARIQDRAALRSLHIGSQGSSFLNRADERLTISFEEVPASVDISLQSDDDLVIYDSSLPLNLAVDAKTATIATVINPGQKLDFQIAVPLTFKARMRVEAHYLNVGDRYRLASGALLRDRGGSVVAHYQIYGPGVGPQ